MVGGLIVGMTSVGSGSLMIILLLFVYPLIGAKQLVGTDLSQAVPLTMAAALGALVFGHVDFSVTTSIIIGSVPAAIAGSLLSSRAPDQYIRPAITLVIFVSGLKYIGPLLDGHSKGLAPSTLAWAAGAAVVVGVAGWLSVARPWQASAEAEPEMATVSTGGGTDTPDA
jgi:hypothetical protein